MSERTAHRSRRPHMPPAWVHGPLIACRGGLLEGQWFTGHDWERRQVAADRMAERGQRPADSLYAPTERTIPHPEWPIARGVVWICTTDPEATPPQAIRSARELVFPTSTSAPTTLPDPIDQADPSDQASEEAMPTPPPARPAPTPARTQVPVRGTAGGARRDLLVPAALAYAARGWHVFPLRPDDKRPAFPDHAENRCDGRDLRCRRAGRHVSWEERATLDPARIRAAWTSAPYGIGIATGPSGLLVIDLDQPKPSPSGAPATPPAEWNEPGIGDGADVFAAVCQRHRHPVPWDTYTVRTASGGTHLYFTAPTGAGAPELRCTAGRMGWLIDTRAGGGYVVAPPSTVAGRAYLADDENAEAAPLPAWIAAGLAPAPLPAQEPSGVRLTAGGDRAGAYLTAAINGAVGEVRGAAGGQRNRALYLAAVQLGQLVAGGALGEADVRGALLLVAAEVGLSPGEAAGTVTSGLRAGARRPRYVPESRAA